MEAEAFESRVYENLPVNISIDEAEDLHPNDKSMQHVHPEAAPTVTTKPKPAPKPRHVMQEFQQDQPQQNGK